MTWAVPTWWPFLLLALAAFRTWRLIAEDTILDPIRVRLLTRGEPDEYRAKWVEFIRCPWCAGAWISVAWWLFWVWQPHWTLVVATPFAISAIVGLVAANFDRD